MTDSRTIFQLRREGRIEEAYELARQLFSRNPDDEWVVKAYGWVLYDKLKAAQSSGNLADAGHIAELLVELNVGQDDEMLYNNIQRLLARQNPREIQLAEASGYDYNGDHEKALNLFRQIAPQFVPSDISFHNSYGWCLYKYLKSLIKNEAGGLDTYRHLVEEYFGITPEKPSALHSMMLMLALQQFKDQAQVILQWQDKFTLENFRTEDFEVFLKDGKKYPGLAERATQTLAKVLLSSGTREQTEQFQPQLDCVLSKSDNNLWLYYYKAKMLVKAGKNSEAETFLIPVVRQKHTEYWAWALMGDIFAVTGHEKALSCYCKALTCRAEEKYLINTRLSFGKLLHSTGYLNEAKTEIEFSVKARLEAGLTIPPPILAIENDDWYQKAIAYENNLDFYKNNLSLAETVVFGDLPWLKGNFISTYLHPEDHKKNLRARLLLCDRENVSFFVSVRVSKYSALRDMAPGDAIMALINPNEGRSVVEISKREASEKYDMAESMVGVVDHVNWEKGIVHVMVSKEIDTLIYGDPVYKVGDFVRVKLLVKDKGGHSRYETLVHEVSGVLPSLQICQHYRGALRLNYQKTAGKVQTVNIGANLVQKFGLSNSDGRTLSGLAVNSYNRINGRWEWKAITVDIQ